MVGLWDRISHEGGKVYVEDRVLVLTFYRPGDEYYPQYDKIRLIKRAWKILNRKPLGK